MERIEQPPIDSQQNEPERKPTDESLIHEKQTLLQQEIIDKDYDHEKFIIFCTSQKPNGDDLSSWTVEELTNIIKSFQETEQSESAPKSPVTEDSNDKLEVSSLLESLTEKQMEAIDCRRLETTIFSNKQLSITLDNPQKKSNYILYEVATSPFNYKVLRRYNDFYWLSKIIAKLYPFHRIPPLPEKKYTNNRFDNDFILKRMKMLEMFINEIAGNELFKATEAFYAFLTITNRDHFKQKMNELSSFKPSSYIEETKTLDGKLYLSQGEEDEQFFKKFQRYFSMQKSILNDLHQHLNNVYKGLNGVIDSLTEVKKKLDALNLVNSQLIKKQHISKSYEEVSCFINNWKNILFKQNNLIKIHVKDFYKYILIEMDTFETMLNKREEIKNKYHSENTKTENKKQKAFNSRDIAKFELNQEDCTIDRLRITRDKEYAMNYLCYKDMMNVKMIFTQYGYANYVGKEEIKRMICKHAERIIDNLKVLDTDFRQTLNDGITMWTNMETFIQCCDVDN